MFKNKAQQMQELQAQFSSLPTCDQSELLLTMAFSKVDMEIVKGAIERYVGWHQNKHATHESCEYCERIEKMVVLYTMMKGFEDAWAEFGKNK